MVWLIEKKVKLLPALVASLSANEGLSHLAFLSPFCFPANISPAVLNQGRPENKPPAAVSFILLWLKAVTDTSTGNKVHTFTDDQRLPCLRGDNKKPFDDKTASPGWDWLMTFRDGGDHFGPKRRLFTGIELPHPLLFFSSLFSKCRHVSGATVNVAYWFWASNIYFFLFVFLYFFNFVCFIKAGIVSKYQLLKLKTREIYIH